MLINSALTLVGMAVELHRRAHRLLQRFRVAHRIPCFLGHCWKDCRVGVRCVGLVDAEAYVPSVGAAAHWSLLSCGWSSVYVCSYFCSTGSQALERQQLMHVLRSCFLLPAQADLWAAVAMEDGMGYMEPPRLYRPVRQCLGALLLATARPAEAWQVVLNPESRSRVTQSPDLPPASAVTAPAACTGAAAAAQRWHAVQAAASSTFATAGPGVSDTSAPSVRLLVFQCRLGRRDTQPCQFANQVLCARPAGWVTCRTIRGSRPAGVSGRPGDPPRGWALGRGAGKVAAGARAAAGAHLRCAPPRAGKSSPQCKEYGRQRAPPLLLCPTRAGQIPLDTARQSRRLRGTHALVWRLPSLGLL